MLRGLLAVLGVGLALTLSGCVRIVSNTATQYDTIGDVGVTTRVCESSGASGAACPTNQTNSNWDVGANDAQLLVAYRIPADVPAPGSITAGLTAGGGQTTLTPSDSYVSELNRLVPPDSGFKWAGYISPTIPQASQNGDDQADIVARFALPRGADGSPYAGPFRYHPIVGARAVDGSRPASRPVACGTAITNKNEVGGEQTICGDSLGPGPKLTANAAFSGNYDFATKDLGVVNGPAASAQAGTAVSVPFTIRAVGMDGSPLFSLSAGTTVPGGIASPSQGTYSPQPSDTTVPVSVNVPANAPPGTYDVSLSAVLGSTQVRTGVAKLTVTPGADAPPSVTVTVAKRRLGRALRRGLPVTVGCNEACAIAVRLRSAGTVGRGSAALIAAGKRKVVAKFTRRAKRRFARRRAVSLTVRVTATDTAGNKTTRSRKVKLRR